MSGDAEMAEFRLRAFEADWVEPLWEQEPAPLRELLLAEAERWAVLGRELGYFGDGPLGARLLDRPRSEFEILFEGTDAAKVEGPGQFASMLLQAQDDLTPPRRDFLLIVFFASEAEWRGRFQDLKSVSGELAGSGESHAPPTLAAEVGWALIGADSEIEGAATELPAGWRSQDLSTLCELIPGASERLSAVERWREGIRMLVSGLSRGEQPAPAVHAPVASARALVEAGLFDDAAAILEAAGVDPSPEGNLLLGKIAVARSDVETAIDALERAAEAGVGEAALLLGQLRIEFGQEEAGRQALERAAELGERQAYTRLASALRKQGNEEAVSEVIRRGATAEDPMSILSLTGTLVLSDQAAMAADLLAGTGRRFPAEGLMEIAGMLRERNHLPEAIAVAIEADVAGADRAAGLLGQLHHEVKNLGAAETWYRKAVAAGRTSMHLNLGNVLRELGDAERAEEQYRLALEAGDTGAHLNLGQLLQDRGETEAARRAYEDAIEAGDKGGHALLGMLLYGSDGDEAEAERHLAAAVAAGRYEGAVVFGTLLADRGRLREAVDLLRRAAERGVEGAWADLGLYSVELGEPEAAEAAYRRGIEEGQGTAAYNLGVLLHERGEIEPAREAYERATELGYRFAASNLGSMLIGEGAEEEAEEWFRRAVGNLDPRGLVALGSLAASQGRFEEAREMGQTAVKVGEPCGYFLIADAETNEGRMDAAAESLAKAKEAGIGPAWGRSALILAAAGEFDAASAEAREGWRRRDPRSGLLLARLLREGGDVTAAEEVAVEVLGHTREQGATDHTFWRGEQHGALPPLALMVPVGFSHALVELGAAHVARGKLDEAAPILREAAEAGRAEAASNLAVVHARRGEGEEERRWLRRAVDLGEGEALLRLVELHADEGDYEAAEQELPNAEAVDSTSLDRARGTLLMRRELFPAAERAFERAASSESSSPVDTFMVAYCREKRGDLKGAAEAYEEVTDVILQAVHNLGVMRDRMGDKEGAIAAYREAAEAGSVMSRTDLAATLLEVGKLDEAEAMFESLIAEGPAPHDLANYGVLLARRGRPREAVARLREAGESPPRVLLNLGRLLLEEDELAEAVDPLSRALDEGITEAAIDLGEAYEKLGHLEKAEAAYREAFASKDPEVAMRLGRLSSRLEKVEQEFERLASSERSLTLLLYGGEEAHRPEARDLDLVEVSLG